MSEMTSHCYERTFNMRKEIAVNYEGKKSYSITLNDSFAQLPEDLTSAIGADQTKKICIVSDSQVANIYLNKISDLLKNQFPHIFSFVFEAGEQSKNMDTVQKLYEHLILNKFDRHDLLIALGGGVVGDLIYRCDLFARYRFYPGAHLAARSGRFQYRRKDRRRLSTVQKHGRRFLPAQISLYEHGSIPVPSGKTICKRHG